MYFFWGGNSITQLRLFCNFPFVADLRVSLGFLYFVEEKGKHCIIFSEVNKEQVQIMRFLTARATFFDETKVSIVKKCAQNLWNKPFLILLRGRSQFPFTGFFTFLTTPPPLVYNRLHLDHHVPICKHLHLNFDYLKDSTCT